MNRYEWREPYDLDYRYIRAGVAHLVSNIIASCRRLLTSQCASVHNFGTERKMISMEQYSQLRSACILCRDDSLICIARSSNPPRVAR